MKFDEFALTRRAMIGSALAFGGAAACARPIMKNALTPLTVDEVIRRNTQARGGRRALDKVHTVAIDVQIDEDGQRLNGHYAATDKGLARIDIYAGDKSAGSEGVDIQGAWYTDRGQIKVSNAAGTAALHNGADNNVLGWHRFPERGHKLTLMPSELIEGTTYSVVEILYSNGQRSYFYIDPATWLAVRRRDERAYHPDASMTKRRVETRFSDFQRVKGVLVPHLDQDFDMATAALLASHKVLNRRINPNLPSDYFDRSRRASSVWA